MSVRARAKNQRVRESENERKNFENAAVNSSTPLRMTAALFVQH